MRWHEKMKRMNENRIVKKRLRTAARRVGRPRKRGRE